MNDIIESIIISEGCAENNDEYSMQTPNTATLPKINEESHSSTTSSSDQNNSSEASNGNANRREKENETCYDSELDESTTFINYTHSYELEDVGSGSDSEQSLSDTIEEGGGDEEESENGTKSDSEQSSSD